MGGYANSGREHISVVGQEIESVAPYTIDKVPGHLYEGSPDTSILMFDPAPIVFILVNAVKELSARIDILEGKIT